MGQQKKKERCWTHFVHQMDGKKRKAVVVSVLVTIVIVIFTWISLNSANAAFEFVQGILCAGAILDGSLVVAKKEKFYIFLITAVVLLCYANATVARAVLESTADEQEPIVIEGGTEVSAGEKNGIVTETGEEIIPEKKLSDFVWAEDIYIINIYDYFVVIDDNMACMQHLMDEYTKYYTQNGHSVLEMSEAELNEGAYGAHIGLAQKYASDYEKCQMVDVKETALLREIEERDLADKEYEKFDNLRILGDLHIEKIELLELTGMEKKTELEKALEYYLRALPLAYWDEKSSKGYITELWKEIKKTYEELYKLEAVDDPHKKQIAVIIELCEMYIE